jgi:hypothetical protein
VWGGGLHPGLGGRREVQTGSTSHIGDLDRRTYNRQPATSSSRMDDDYIEVTFTRVEVWPAVGQRSSVWFDDPVDPLVEQWRFSSTMGAIRRLDPERR